MNYSDFAGFGSYLIDAEDTLSYHLIDFGTNGQNNWDFSYLQEGGTDSLIIIDPDNNPYIDSFPQANYTVRLVDDDTLSGYLFFDLNTDNFKLLGMGMLQDTTFLSMKNQPYQLIIDLPATYDEADEIVYEYTSIIEVPIDQYSSMKMVEKYYDTLVVNAWGTLDLPDFSDIDVLRDERRTKTYDSTFYQTIADTTLVDSDSSYAVTYTWFTNDENFKFRILEISLDGNFTDKKGIVYDTTLTYTADANIVSLLNETNEYNVKIYPNPAKNYVKITNLPINCKKIEIFTISGKKLREIKVDNKFINISTQNLTTGVYTIKFGETGISEKLIIK